jgi:hypothetical protein
MTCFCTGFGIMLVGFGVMVYPILKLDADIHNQRREITEMQKQIIDYYDGKIDALREKK